MKYRTLSGNGFCFHRVIASASSAFYCISLPLVPSVCPGDPEARLWQDEVFLQSQLRAQRPRGAAPERRRGIWIPLCTGGQKSPGRLLKLILIMTGTKARLASWSEGDKWKNQMSTFTIYQAVWKWFFLVDKKVNWLLFKQKSSLANKVFNYSCSPIDYFSLPHRILLIISHVE